MRASTIPRAWSKSVSEARQHSRWSDDDWGRSSAVTVQSVQLAGMSERLPSGSTTSNNSVLRRLTADITANKRPSNGCRSRRIVTDLEEVRPRLSGEATLVRFADDFVMTFETHHDAQRVLEVLGKRRGRHGLTLHPDKTRFIDFRRQRRGGTHADRKDAAFDFLGFTHASVKSRNGKNVVRQTTAKTKLCPRADRAHGLVPSQSASADPRSARPAVC
jgi:hypothetical protein